MSAWQSQSEKFSKSYSRLSSISERLKECSAVLTVTSMESPGPKQYEASSLFQNDKAEFSKFLEDIECFSKKKGRNGLEKINFLKRLERISQSSRKKSPVQRFNIFLQSSYRKIKACEHDDDWILKTLKDLEEHIMR